MIQTILTLLIALNLQAPVITYYPPISVSQAYLPQTEAKTALVADETPIWKRELESREDVKEYIVWSANQHGVNPELALDLAEIESNFNPKARNSDSSAKGLYQWIDGSWERFCQSDTFKPSVLDPKENIECTMRLLSTGDLHHWTADKNTKARLKYLGHL